jgi:hypothetical protein
MAKDETRSAGLTHRRPESLLGVLAANREDHPLQAALAFQVPPDLLDLDSRGFLEREASDPGPEGNQREARRAELVGLRERARRGPPDDLGGGRATELHGRGVDHPPARHLTGRRLDRFPEPDRRPLVALALDLRAACPGDRASNPAAVPQLGVGGVRDRVDLEFGDVRLLDLDLRHVRSAGYLRAVADEVDRQQLLTALTTEHFGLAGTRAQVTGESSARAALYISAVSSTLVALGFIGQISEVGDTFNVFALTALPTLYVLGLFTFVRTVENGVEDLMMGRAINRIRHYYLEVAGEQARYFMLSGHDDAVGVIRNMGVSLERRQQFFTTGTMIAVINSVVGGGAVAIAVGAFTGAPLGVCAGIGGVVAIGSLAWLLRMENRLYHEMGGFAEVLFPSPEGDGGD